MEGLWLPFSLGGDEMTHVGVPVLDLMPTLEKLQQDSLPAESRLLEVLLERVPKHEVGPLDVPEGEAPSFKPCGPPTGQL